MLLSHIANNCQDIAIATSSKASFTDVNAIFLDQLKFAVLDCSPWGGLLGSCLKAAVSSSGTVESRLESCQSYASGDNCVGHNSNNVASQ